MPKPRWRMGRSAAKALRTGGRQVTRTSLDESDLVEGHSKRGNAAASSRGGTDMAEIEERIARLEQLLSAHEVEVDEAVMRHNLCQLRQLRAEISNSIQ